MQVTASLGELAIFVSGRTTEIWWPPEVQLITCQLYCVTIIARCSESQLRANLFCWFQICALYQPFAFHVVSQRAAAHWPLQGMS